MLREIRYRLWFFITVNYVSLSLVLYLNRIKNLSESKVIALIKPAELKETEAVNENKKSCFVELI